MTEKEGEKVHFKSFSMKTGHNGRKESPAHSKKLFGFLEGFLGEKFFHDFYKEKKEEGVVVNKSEEERKMKARWRA